MARLRDPDIDKEQDRGTNRVHSMLDEVNSMLEYCISD